jgi:hypothetical protein
LSRKQKLVRNETAPSKSIKFIFWLFGFIVIPAFAMIYGFAITLVYPFTLGLLFPNTNADSAGKVIMLISLICGFWTHYAIWKQLKAADFK